MSREVALSGEQPTPVYRADPTKFGRNFSGFSPRRGGAAQTLPWPPERAGLYRTIFPQMTNRLPEEEAAQLRFEFETEIARLKAA